MSKSDGFSLIELLIVIAIILIIAAIAIPHLLRARISANEASAISTLRTITTCEITYKINYPTIGYSDQIEKLGMPGPGVLPDETRADLLPNELADPPHMHSGYVFSATGDMETFRSDAVPLSPGTSGVRSFCTDTPAVLYFSPTETGCDPGPLQISN